MDNARQQASDIEPAELGRQMYQRGVRTMLYTDVDREGLLGGIDVLAGAGPRIAGVVLGQAMYTGRLSLRAAVARAHG